jgi:hypothetical protein
MSDEVTPLTERQREQISKAADEIERRGLTYRYLAEHPYDNPDSCEVCTIGGLGVAHFGDTVLMYEKAYSAANPQASAFDQEWLDLVSAVARQLPGWSSEPLARIFRWNDEQTVDPDTGDLARLRDTEDVVATLRESQPHDQRRHRPAGRRAAAQPAHQRRDVDG